MGASSGDSAFQANGLHLSAKIFSSGETPREERGVPFRIDDIPHNIVS